MKIIIFNAGRKQRKYRNKKIFSVYIFEKFLFFTFVIVFLSLVIVQAAMMNPKLRAVFVNENSLEGNLLKDEEYLYKRGEIFISLKSENTNKKVKVLLNGEKVASFVSNVVKINVKDGDVVEIDSTMAGDAEVEIISASSNIIDRYKGTKVKLDSEIKRLAKIQID